MSAKLYDGVRSLAENPRELQVVKLNCLSVIIFEKNVTFSYCRLLLKVHTLLDR